MLRQSFGRRTARRGDGEDSLVMVVLGRCRWRRYMVVHRAAVSVHMRHGSDRRTRQEREGECQNGEGVAQPLHVCRRHERPGASQASLTIAHILWSGH